MPAQRPSRKTLLWLCLAFASASAWAHGASLSQADVESIYGRYRTTADSHGLYEIWQAADAFVTDHNRKHQTSFEVLGPDLRIMVSACLVPLAVKWARPDPGGRGIGVNVSCARTARAYEKRWEIFVPVSTPRSGHASKSLG